MLIVLLFVFTKSLTSIIYGYLISALNATNVLVIFKIYLNKIAIKELITFIFWLARILTGSSLPACSKQRKVPLHLDLSNSCT